MVKTKEKKYIIELTYNEPSNEALEEFTKKMVEIYYKLVS